jgi:competence ComEA-like helix-hairpin-helix protein
MDQRTQHISYGGFLFLFLSCLLIFSLKVSDLPSRSSSPLPMDDRELNVYGDTTALQGSHRLVLGLSMDINDATHDELTLLPGIGKTLARLILKTRQERGGFLSIEELKEVEGIDEARLKAIGPFIEVKAPPDLQAAL